MFASVFYGGKDQSVAGVAVDIVPNTILSFFKHRSFMVCTMEFVILLISLVMFLFFI